MTKELVFQQNRLLKELCTFGIGGPARYLVEVRNIPEMQEALKYCQAHSLPFFILGKGSNCLFDDQGFDGLVIQNKIDFIEFPEPGVFRVGSGYSFSLLGVQTAREGWSGLEFASGIPATVGGAVFMNAGANRGETSRPLKEVEFVDLDGAVHQFKRESLTFGYRHSPFQLMKGAIVSATFQLVPKLNAREDQIQIVQTRQKTQPTREKSAGCVFRNPECAFAGQLIEESGLKGVSIGGAQVSDMHANYIINARQATSLEVKELIQLIQKTVFEKKGIVLEKEIRFISPDGK